MKKKVLAMVLAAAMAASLGACGGSQGSGNGGGGQAPAAPANMCPHSPEFFANPDWEAVVNGQRAEMEQRALAAQQAAQQAAQEQQQAAPPPEQPQAPAQ